MKHFLILFVVLSSLVSTACGCIFVDDKSFAAKQTDNLTHKQVADEARVQNWWQNFMSEKLASTDTATKAYGLFSEGGWSNSGQIIVVVSDAEAILYYAVPSAKPRQPVSEKLTKDELAELTAVIEKSMKLSDVDEPVYDGINYEFVMMEKTADKSISTSKRVYIRKSGAKPWPDHDALVKSFQNAVKRIKAIPVPKF